MKNRLCRSWTLQYDPETTADECQVEVQAKVFLPEGSVTGITISTRRKGIGCRCRENQNSHKLSEPSENGKEQFRGSGRL